MKFSNTAYRKSPLERGAQAQRWRSQRPINNAPATLLSILVTRLLLAPRISPRFRLPKVSVSPFFLVEGYLEVVRNRGRGQLGRLRTINNIKDSRA